MSQDDEGLQGSPSVVPPSAVPVSPVSESVAFEEESLPELPPSSLPHEIMVRLK